VYYTDTTYTTVLRISTNDGGAGTAADNAVMKSGANGYRLPTEAEWEYAARGGNQGDPTNWGYTYAGSNTVGDVAWYSVNSHDLGNLDPDYGAHPVGTKAANSKGLYDMSGNVYEWCWDWHEPITVATDPAGPVSGLHRVWRSGSWFTNATGCSVVRRDEADPGIWDIHLGFRVASP
jgi:formylglycine-generating enzyme required for sulfatase activity